MICAFRLGFTELSSTILPSAVEIAFSETTTKSPSSTLFSTALMISDRKSSPGLQYLVVSASALYLAIDSILQHSKHFCLSEKISSFALMASPLHYLKQSCSFH